jgi:hypothetical protein
LRAGQVAEAVEAARQLLPAPQQRLPDELEAAVEAAGEARDQGDHQLAGATLGEAVELAVRLRYL